MVPVRPRGKSWAGSGLADVLLGIPATSSIAFGNADKFLRGTSYAAYLSDDWRVSPILTVNAGVRWEYNTPVTEIYGRLVNLDIAKGFSAISPVVANNPKGSLTGNGYPDSLVEQHISQLKNDADEFQKVRRAFHGGGMGGGMGPGPIRGPTSDRANRGDR